MLAQNGLDGLEDLIQEEEENVWELFIQMSVVYIGSVKYVKE